MDEYKSDSEGDLGDLDTLIKRFLTLKEGQSAPDLDGSFQDDDLFKDSSDLNASSTDYQWFNDEIRFDTFSQSETGSPLCIGINTDYDVANIDMENYEPHSMGLAGAPIYNLNDSPSHGSEREKIASMTGSILEQLAEYEDSITSGQSADLNNSMDMSICKSENLFSPQTDIQPELLAPLTTFSTDSLDARSELLAHCAATNYNNYTIAFNGNNGLEESISNLNQNNKSVSNINQSQKSPMTDWNELISVPSTIHTTKNTSVTTETTRTKNKVSNNNGSSTENTEASGEFDTPENENVKKTPPRSFTKIQSPNVDKIKLYSVPQPRKIFEVKSFISTSTASSELISPNSGMSSDESLNIHLSNDMNSELNGRITRRSNLYKNRPLSTAKVSEILKKSIQIQTSSHFQKPISSSSSQSSPVYICYPNYTLPDLQFLKEQKDVILLPTHYKVPYRQKREKISKNESGYNRNKRPFSCNDLDELRKTDFSGIRDWPSLHFLLPPSYKNALKDLNMKFEENNEDEKRAEASSSYISNSGKNDKFENDHVVMRRKSSKKSPNLYSEPQNENRKGRVFSGSSKRYSLQEVPNVPMIPEINEMTTEINMNLTALHEFDLFENFKNIPSDLSSISGELGVGLPGPPQNTPKISYIDNQNQHSCSQTRLMLSRLYIPNLTEKQNIADAVSQSVSRIKSICKPPQVKGPSSSQQNLIIFSQSPGGKLILDGLCPSLYSLLSDGLCPNLDTIFGKIPNTVWRVVEASIQYGPTAQTLNELVMKINSEESLAEGPMKFNAFICGLLNLGNLSSWLLFLRTKERLLRTHYEPNGLMFLCNTSTRTLYDQMVEKVNYLTKLPFQLDIFYEAKILHQSIASSSSSNRSKNSFNGRISSASSKRHSVDSNKLSGEKHSQGAISSKSSKYYVNQLKKTQMKRSFSDERPVSGVKINFGATALPKSKTFNQNFLKISVQEKGIEPVKTIQRPRSLGNQTQIVKMLDDYKKEAKDSEKFKNLRLQWEMLSNEDVKRDSSMTSPGVSGGSKIPRLIISPTKVQPGLAKIKSTKR